MFTSLSISGYRGFKTLAVERLGRVNLVAGSNGSGKTSLLEALFLLAHGGNAQPAINRNVVRGGIGGGVTPDANARALWGSLFSDLDLLHPVSISAIHSHLGSLQLSIEHRYAAMFRVTSTSRDTRPRIDGSHELHFLLTQRLPDGRHGRSVKSRIFFERNAPEVKVEGDPLVIQCVILSSCADHSEDDAKRLGQMRLRKEAGFVVEALRIIEPRLQAVDVIPGPGGHMLWGDIGLSEQIPLAVLGDGLNRLAKLVLAMGHDRNLVVLADEIENGFHHTVLEKVWKVIYETAERFETQLIATTHSFESIEAAHAASPGHDLALHRLELGDHITRCVTYDADSIEGAVKHGLEVR